MIDVEDAIKPGAPILHDHIKFEDKPSNIAGKLEHKLGDVDAGFAAADVVVERSFRTEPVHQGYIEPHACLVSVVDGKATIWSSSQGQFMVRAMCAYLTGLAAERHPRHPGRDRRRLRRQDHRLPGAGGPGAGAQVGPAGEDGDDARGGVPRLRADLGLVQHGQDRRHPGRQDRRRRRAPTTCRPGAFPGSPIRGAAGCAFAPYDIPNVHSVGFDVVSNRSKVAAYRAPGAPIGAYAVECVLDELAEALKMDPLELRLKNAAKQGTKAAYGPIFPRIGFEETLKAALRASALQGAARPQPGPRRRQRLLVQRRRRSRAPRSTSPRTARWSSSPAIPISAARAPRPPTSRPSCSASTTARSRC